jgi:hypothetical protein
MVGVPVDPYGQLPRSNEKVSNFTAGSGITRPVANGNGNIGP